MKQLIALMSIGLSIGFATIAKAEDHPTIHEATYENAPPTTTTTTTNQQPGTAEINPPPTSGSMDTSKTTTTTSETTRPSQGTQGTTDLEAKSSKTCTDEAGMTYTRGQKGFKDCMKTTSKPKRSDQGGQMGTSKDTSKEPHEILEGKLDDTHSNS